MGIFSPSHLSKPEEDCVLVDEAKRLYGKEPIAYMMKVINYQNKKIEAIEDMMFDSLDNIGGTIKDHREIIEATLDKIKSKEGIMENEKRQ